MECKVTSHVGPQVAVSPLRFSRSPSSLLSHVGTQAWTPLVREALARRGLLVSKEALASLSPRSSVSFASPSSVSSSSTVLPRLATVLGPVGACLLGNTVIGGSDAGCSTGLHCGVGGSMATRLETIFTAPVIPSESEGEAHSSPSTSQLAAHSSLLTPSSSVFPHSPLFGQSRQCKIQTDKESKTVDKEKDKCNRVAGWGG